MMWRGKGWTHADRAAAGARAHHLDSVVRIEGAAGMGEHGQMSKSILIVDDSASMRQMVRMALTGAGHAVVEAADGAEALVKAEARRFDLVLTDLHMPGMSGLDLIGKLRLLPAYRGVPILFLTTESDAEKRAAGKAAGATGWITKPFKPDQLLAVVHKVLG
jgi:two-component system, chemotaxis family, chemotaxis protein CheY